MNLKNSLYNVFQGGVILLLCPSAFCNPLCSSDNSLGSPEPSIRHLTIGLEKMTQALRLKHHFLPSIAKANLPIEPGLRKHTYVSSVFFSFLKLFIYLFLAALGLGCCARAFSSCGEQGLLLLWSMGSRHAGFSS